LEACDSYTARLSILYTGDTIPSMVIPLPLTMLPGSRILVAMGLQCFSVHEKITGIDNIFFKPSGIISAMYIK